MCGRFALNVTPAEMEKLFGYDERPNFPPRDNIAPTDPIAVVTFENGKRHFRLMRWGLLPAWLKEPDGFPTLFNARGETIETKPAFRAAYRRRRCLIPVDGWYEWKEEGGRKQPYYIHLADPGIAGLAGLWEEWISPDGSPIESFAVITTDANEDAAKVHDRMPVIIEAAQFPLWLEGDAKDVATLLRPLQQGKVRFHKVDRRMSSARVDDARRAFLRPGIVSLHEAICLCET